MGADWSPQEVRATVADYMAMLRFELSGQSYNKTTHRRALLAQLVGRTDGAVEMKHQNISAVLRDLGHFWIPGYKPRSNYQGILADEVAAWIVGHSELDRYSLAAADAPTATPEHVDFSNFEVSTPPARLALQSIVREAQEPCGEITRMGIKRDYTAREARNSSLGRAGEELVVKFEQYRLAKQGLDRLAAKVEHVSQTSGDGLGFDVLSFDVEGKERYIEVKTTAFAKETPFFASSNELRFAKSNSDRYFLYRLFEFRKEPKCFKLPGMIQDHCALEPIVYRCSFM